MDQEMFLEIANEVEKLEMFPYFEIAHYILMCMYVREDVQAGTAVFSRKHPFACWLSSMMMVFAGGIMTNFLLGESVLTPLADHERLGLATICWFVINYSPFDLAYKLGKFAPLVMALQLVVQVRRTKRITIGIDMGLAKTDNNIIAICCGVTFACGSNMIRTFERLVRGVWTPGQHEALQPTFVSKACLVAAILFVLEKKTDYINVPHSAVYLGVVVFFVYFKLSSLLLGIHDPFVPFENLFCAIFCGGMFDALRDAIQSTKEKAAKVDTKNGKTDKDKKRD